MGELAATIREAITALGASDRGCTRFGASHHHYELAAPITTEQADAVERTLGATLPDDVRTFATEISGGGAGPGYGWVPLDRAARSVTEAPAKVAARAWDEALWTRALPIAHLGCGYVAVIALDGRARGEVWIDARAIDLVAPIHASFTAMYIAWIDRLARGALPEAYVRAGVCAFSCALSGYLGVMEQRLGLAESSLAGPALREVLEQLGPGAIEIAAETTGLFTPGERVDPCVACAHLIETLAVDGLRRDVVAPTVRRLV